MRGPDWMTVCFLCTVIGLASALDVYVAPAAMGGRDTNNGTSIDSPFATLTRARDFLRAAKVLGSTVFLRGGKYFLSAPLALTNADNFTTWKAYNHEEVIIAGGVAIGVGQPSYDARLPPASRGTVYQVNLTAAGVTNLGTIPSGNSVMTLIVKGEGFIYARYPNRNLDSPYPTNNTWIFIPRDTGTPSALLPFPVALRARIQSWTSSPNMVVHGYLAFWWRDEYCTVAVVDFNLNTFNLTCATPPPYNTVYGVYTNGGYVVMNVVEELDQQGEFWIDRSTAMLYYYPIPGVAYGDSDVIVNVINNIITMTNVQGITFEDVIIESSRQDAVTVTGSLSRGVTFRRCTIRNTGQGSGLVLNGYDHVVESCNVYYTGGYGITATGGDRNTLTSSNILVNNSLLHDFGRWYETYHPGIQMAGVGITLSHCEIYNNPHTAIGYSGNDHLMEYNIVRDVLYGTYDAGAIYAGRDLTVRGVVIRYNLFYNIAFNSEPRCNSHTSCVIRAAVYSDDHLSGTTVFGNIFYRCNIGFFSNQGRDHQISNNVFLNVDTPVRLSGGTSFGTVNSTIYDRLYAVPFQSQRWTTRYPALFNILQNNPWDPRGCYAGNNVIVNRTRYAYDDYQPNLPLTGTKWLMASSCGGAGCSLWNVSVWGVGASLTTDPGFDLARAQWPAVVPENFRLTDEGLANAQATIDFQRIPTERIGVFRYAPTNDSSGAASCHWAEWARMAFGMVLALLVGLLI